MNKDIYNSGTHSESGVDLSQIRECLSLSHTERLKRLEESVKSQLLLNKIASQRTQAQSS